MSVKLYKEIKEYIENQYEVLKSFKRERPSELSMDTKRLIQTLEENISILEKEIEKIVDRGE